MPDEPTMELECLVGPYAGHVIEYPKSVAENLLMTGQAREPAGTEPKRPAKAVKETATRPEPEKATKTKESKASAEWDLKMSPEEYLERYPDGPNADAAREALGE